MSVQLFQGVTVSGRHVVENFDLFMESSADPVELIVQKAATKISRSGKTHPFVYDEKAYFTALRYVREGASADAVVATLSRLAQIKRHMRVDERVIDPADGIATRVSSHEYAWPIANGGQSGYSLKPSRDPEDRFSVNRRLRIPDHKKRSHKDPKRYLGDGKEIQFGTFRTSVRPSEFRQFYGLTEQRSLDSDELLQTEQDWYWGEHGPVVLETAHHQSTAVVGYRRTASAAQQKALAHLIGLLQTPSDQIGRHGKVIKAYEDLNRFSTSAFPDRGMHNNLMSALRTATLANIQVSVRLIADHAYGKAVVGYTMQPV